MLVRFAEDELGKHRKVIGRPRGPVALNARRMVEHLGRALHVTIDHSRGDKQLVEQDVSRPLIGPPKGVVSCPTFRVERVDASVRDVHTVPAVADVAGGAEWLGKVDHEKPG